MFQMIEISFISTWFGYQKQTKKKNENSLKFHSIIFVLSIYVFAFVGCFVEEELRTGYFLMSTINRTFSIISIIGVNFIHTHRYCTYTKTNFSWNSRLCNLCLFGSSLTEQFVLQNHRYNRYL